MSDQFNLNKYHLRHQTCLDKLERLDRVISKYYIPVPALQEIRVELLDDIKHLEKQIGIFDTGKKLQERNPSKAQEARS